MQYKVPQDVQREDTIIGPLTLRQMIILGVGGGIAYALYVSLAKTYYIEVWLPPVAIISAITLAFAFLKIHNLPFHIFLMNLIEYNLLSKKRVWLQGTGTPQQSSTPEKKQEQKKEDNPTQTQEKNIEKVSKIIEKQDKSNK